MNSMTPVLIDYWRRLPAHPAESRRRSLEESRDRVAAGELPADALIPYALGDVDEEVVFEAAAAFLDAGRTGTHGGGSAVGDAIEWVRRGLALNRGAVFAALLAAGDASVNERLAAHRLTLSTEETATVCRRAAADDRKPTREFLAGWAELLGAGAERPELAFIAAALGAASVLDS